jgi:hypothetical protein
VQLDASFALAGTIESMNTVGVKQRLVVAINMMIEHGTGTLLLML